MIETPRDLEEREQMGAAASSSSMSAAALTLELEDASSWYHEHEKPGDSCLECLPEELLLHVLCFLDTFSLHQMSLVSTRFYRLANDRTLWESLYQEGASEEHFSCIIRDPEGNTVPRSEIGRRLWEQQMKKYAHLRSSCSLIPNQEYRIVVAGPGNAGKSPIIERFIFNYFIPRYDPTVEDSTSHLISSHPSSLARAGQQHQRTVIYSLSLCGFVFYVGYRKFIMVDDTPCLFDITDTPGMEEYSVLRDQYEEAQAPVLNDDDGAAAAETA